MDLNQESSIGKGHQIVAVPRLVGSLPVPIRKITDERSDTERVLVGLRIVCEGKS